MSALGRMCLRLAAVAALRNATLVGENVFDSRVGSVDLTDDIPVGGAIAVYTEQDDGEALSASQGGPPFKPDVELVLEIEMQTRVAVQPAEDGAAAAYEVGVPTTDDELEATVDLIEAQAEIALFRSLAANSQLFRLVAKRPANKTSIRFTDPKSSTKLAIRYVTFKIEIDDREVPLLDGTRAGLDRLPEPFATIAKGWASGPEFEKATNVAALLAGETPPSFLGLDATLEPPASTMTPGNIPQPALLQPWTIPTEQT